MPNRGESGFTSAQMSVSVGGQYTGGGLAGYSGGQSYQFSVKMRETDAQRPRQDTTDGANKSGVGGPTSVKVNLQGFYKGANYPPNFSLYEFVMVTIYPWSGLTFTGVILAESFKPVGDVEKAVEWSVNGETDGIYTFQ